MLCVMAAPAHAIGDSQVKTGTKVSGPDGACGDNDNASNTNVTVCFKAYGDKLYVKDGEADGRSAYGQFDSDYVYWNGGDTKACRNPYGAGTWVVCDYAIVEGTSVSSAGSRRTTRERSTWSATRSGATTSTTTEQDRIPRLI